MKFTITSTGNCKEDIVITMPETPTILRINKQVGRFASGAIEQGNCSSMQTHGRGRYLECAIAKIDDNLQGIVGLGESKRWAFVSAIVTEADDPRIEKGCLIHFLVYGAERTTFVNLLSRNLTNFCLIRIEFNLFIPTQHGTIIRPPTIFLTRPDSQKLQYLQAAKIITEKYSGYLPDATDLHPAKYSNFQASKLVAGLLRLRNPKVVNDSNSTSLKRFSSLFWKQ